MKTIKLILMSFDGSFVTDSTHENLESAFNTAENLGSKWFFYPFMFFTSGTKVIETGSGLIRMSDKKSFCELMFKNRKFTTVIKIFQSVNSYCEKNKIDDMDCFDYENLMIELNRNLIR